MIKSFIIATGMMCLIYAPNASIATAPTRTLNEYTVKELVAHFASQYQVSESQMLTTIKCESNFKTTAVGDGGKSFGLAQIHLPSHPKTTREQALNKVYAVEFMAKAFSKKQHRMWTCYRMYFM